MLLGLLMFSIKILFDEKVVEIAWRDTFYALQAHGSKRKVLEASMKCIEKNQSVWLPD